ncbi:DUF4344 domain-containing metallopeptidase [Microvirga puerhi]|uniref:DUF4344 domain-containing metallopeptidase n=1 Tax=Microvirga puerhi TaxID=2876078 RepID=A0ABS7VL97_9HYPH|nr:DUF4344 domain-containing metallopeptidase [Microvirga puerhi]MBZ6075910.1 DUF4344 domain-containing metallopeptidase [Microvirga puerhi]
MRLSAAPKIALLATWTAFTMVLATGSAAERSSIQIIYVPPKEQAHEPIYRTLQDKQVLERVRASLADFIIPAKLTIKTEGCDGDINASYESSNKTVSICYEYLAYIQELAQDIPPIAAAEGLTPANYVVGPFLEVVLHELAHAIFDLNKVPILGREEDAADQVAAYALLKMDKQEIRRTIASIAAMYASEAKDAPLKLKDLSDEHGLPAQRFFNLLCISYGKESAMFADIVAQGFLPKERAEQCKGEYQQVTFAITRLIAPTSKNAHRQMLSKRN